MHWCSSLPNHSLSIVTILHISGLQVTLPQGLTSALRFAIHVI